jgi:hypothetical protein
MNPHLAIIAGIIILIGIIAISFSSMIQLPGSQDTSREVPLSFNSSYLVPVYIGTFGPNGSMDGFRDSHSHQNVVTSPPRLPTEQEAPEIAKKVMGRFGGIPKDAVLTRVYTYQSDLFELTNTTGTPLITKENESVIVKYTRQTVNDVPFLGDDFIELALQENEKIDNLWIQWRNHKPAGTACIISPSEATKRLVHGKFFRRPPDHYLVNVTGVELAYYYGNYTWYNIAVLKDIPSIPVEPVWVFHGNDGKGESFSILVPAIDPEQSSTSCSGMSPVAPARLNFSLVQTVNIDTSGMVSIETAQQKVRDFLELPDAIVEYKGKVVGHSGPYREYGFRQYVFYAFSVNGIEVRVDKMTGNVVLADYSRLYTDAPGFTISLERAKAIATDFAARKYPEYNNTNLLLEHSDVRTQGVFSRNKVYRFEWQDFVDIDSVHSLIIEVHPENGQILLYKDRDRGYSDQLTFAYNETLIP